MDEQHFVLVTTTVERSLAVPVVFFLVFSALKCL